MSLDNIRDRDTWPTNKLKQLAERIDKELETRRRQPVRSAPPPGEELETLEQRLLREAKQFEQTARNGVIRGW